MKDFLKELVAEQRTSILKHSVAREYLADRSWPRPICACSMPASNRWGGAAPPRMRTPGVRSCGRASRASNGMLPWRTCGPFLNAMPILTC